MPDMCSTCIAADHCPYYGQDSYYWNERGDCRCDEILADAIEESRREYFDAWSDYIKEEEVIKIKINTILL